jgi:iron complex outermembrane receptor protein
LQKDEGSVSIKLLKQGCSTMVGLRDTLEPDPDNTGVGSFRSLTAFFLDVQREFSCFIRWRQGELMSSFTAVLPAGTASRLITHKISAVHLRERVVDSAFVVRRSLPIVSLALCFFVASLGVLAQSTVSNSTTPTAAAQSLPRVTTTVVVQGGQADEYLPQVVTVGNLDGVPLEQTPLSATVVTRELLTDQQARILSDVVKNDASIGEDYAPVGYYGIFEIRGFPIDLATSLQINGMTIAGEQDVPLENKERVEFLKGIAGVESGVTPAGGMIDYVTKRPAAIETTEWATDHRGSSYGAVDLGHLYGSAKQVGARLNLAGERIASYVNQANGWRAVGTGAADWKISPRAIWKNDFEYQHKVERSVCGYQLLGGTVLPDIKRLHPSTMLGEQAWTKPNTFDTFNTGSRLDYDLTHGWRAFAAASYSHSLIDDNTIYPYGNSVSALDYFFASDGSYDIYDYRNPGELRIDAQAEALAVGNVKTGGITHDLAFGGELFRRSVQQPKKSVNHYLGAENIYAPIQAFPIEDPVLSAGKRVLDDDNHQSATIMQDRIHIPGRIQLLVSGREDSVRDHNNSGQPPTHKLIWMPQYAATFNPIGNLTLYGNYGVMLSLGIQAPWWTDNASAYLSPFNTRQAEVGAKYAPDEKILLTAAFFHMRSPFFYPKAIQATDSVCDYNYAWGQPFAAGDLCFESNGRETHNGVELNAEGKAASWLRLTGSAAAIRAISDDTGTQSFNNKQVLNVPHLRTNVFADLLVPHMHGVHLMPGWSYTGRKEATRDDAVSVPSYNIFNLGARYTPGGEQGHISLRLYADNIADKRYWKDTGANYGDTFIHMGAPTTVRLSAHYTF